MRSFFPRDVLDGILDLIESVSEGFPASYILFNICSKGEIVKVTLFLEQPSYDIKSHRLLFSHFSVYFRHYSGQVW